MPETLLPHHLAMLEASAIHPDVIAERGYRSLDGEDGYAALRSQGFSATQSCLLPGLLMPLHGVDGHPILCLYRPDTPRVDGHGKTRKYEFPRKRTMRLDVPPRCQSQGGNPDVTLVITEGVKKGDAIASRGLDVCVVTLLGVSAWRGTNPQGGTTALADWEHITLTHRRCLIVFDSDVQTNTAMRMAMRRLATFLSSKGADVHACMLPPAPDGQKQGIDDWLASGRSWDEAVTHLRSPWEGVPDPTTMSALAERAHLPRIQLTSGQLDVIGHHAQQAILTHQAQHGPQLFQRAGSLVFVTHSQRFEQAPARSEALPSIQQAPLSKLRAFLCTVATWWRESRSGEYVVTDPPLLIAQLLADFGEWSLPVLTGMTTRPFLRPDRSFCQEPGYDVASGILLAANGFPPLAIPPHPDVFHAQRSWKVLRSLWADFHFETERDAVATLGALLTMLTRSAIDGSCPMFAVVSSTPATGKGRLIDTLALLAIGDVAPRWLATDEEEEMRKQLLTLALAGEQMVLFDNMQGLVGSKQLDGAITSQTMAGRRMGTHEEVRVPFRAVVCLTGNNIVYKGDTRRRVVQITLHSLVEKPEERDDFTHKDLLAHVREHAGRYLEAAWTIILGYLDAGAPPPTKRFGGFEAWNSLVRGCVEWVTGVDMLAGQDTQIAPDEQLEAWKALLESWFACFGDTPHTLAEVRAILNETLTRHMPLGDLLGMEDDIPEAETESHAAFRALSEALRRLDYTGREPLNLRSIGRVFLRYKGRIFGSFVLKSVGQRAHNDLWRVTRSLESEHR